MLKRALKQGIKAIAIPPLVAAGWYRAKLARLRSCDARWSILMYHRVIDDPALDPFRLGMCVRRRHFEQQLEFLARNFRILRLDEAVGRLARGERLPAGTVSITFDDGYRDNLETALPIAERLGVPFSVFVPTGGLAGGEPLWWDRVICAAASSRRRTVGADELGLPAAVGTVSLAGWNAAASVERVLAALWDLPPGELSKSVNRIESALEPRRGAASFAPRLRPQEIAAMHRRGVEIGAHSVSHLNMPLVSRSAAVAEMVESKQVLESIVGGPVVAFAYPGGHLNDETVAAVQSAGFGCAVATAHGINMAPYERHRLVRVGMPDGPLPEVKRALARLAGIAER